MIHTITPNGKTCDQERDERLAAILKSLEEAGIPRWAFSVPDNTCHTVTLPAVVFKALADIAAVAKAGFVPKLDALHEALRIATPEEAVGGRQGHDLTPKKKRVLSEEHKAKLQAGRQKARGETVPQQSEQLAAAE